MSEYNIEQLLKKINELETELKTSKKYGLVWDKENTKEDVVIKCKKNIPILEQDKSKKIICGDDNNIIIEGDNYHVLTSLNFIAKESVDIVYIDPPYNTGHEDFIYNDNYVDKEDGFKHSKWLSFIKVRLELAKNLLKDNGVIFISIDDNEVFNLKLLCDSIFGEVNFLGCITQNKGNAQNDAKNIQKNNDYLLVYCKKRLYITSNGKIKEQTLISKEKREEKEVYIDENGLYFYKGSGLVTGSAPTLKERPNLGYTIYYNHITKDKIAVQDYDIEKALLSNDENYVYSDNLELINQGYIKIRPPKKNNKLGRWTWSLENFNKKKNKILITDNNTPIIKMFVEKECCYKKNGVLLFDKIGRTENIKSILDFSSSQGTIVLNNILGDSNEFNNPKNVEMIKFIIESINNKGAIVLDFFAGFGTTGQAVLELNKEDGGHRKFILCTNNENNICTDVTYPRLKTVITGIRPDGTKYSDGLPANLYYFKTDFIEDQANTEQARYNLVEKVDSLLCIAEDVMEEVERNDYSSHFINGDKHLFIYNDYYNETKFDEFKQRVLSATGQKIVYVYASDNSIDETLIEGNDIELKPIPSKIYEIYKEIVEDIKRGE